MSTLRRRLVGGNWFPWKYGNGLVKPQIPTRGSLVPRYFFPNRLTTGHITPREQMTVVTGNVSWGAEHDGAVITKTIFKGRVTLNCVNITFIDCIFEGYIPNSTTSFCIWPNGPRCSGIRVIDSTIRPAVPDHGTHCVMGHHITFTRCDISGGVDTLSPVAPINTSLRADFFAEGCWLHDLAYFSPDSFHPKALDNKTHNDNTQWGAGLGFGLLGCRVEGFADPTIGDAMQPSVDTATNHVSGNSLYPNLYHGAGVSPIRASDFYPALGEMSIIGNWFSGGAVALNIFAAASSGAFMVPDGSIVAENFFGWDWQSGPDHVIYVQNNQQVTIRDNYRWGGSHPAWYHGDAITGLTGNEDKIDPFDKSVPFTVVKRYA